MGCQNVKLFLNGPLVLFFNFSVEGDGGPDVKKCNTGFLLVANQGILVVLVVLAGTVEVRFSQGRVASQAVLPFLLGELRSPADTRAPCQSQGADNGR